MGAAAPSIVKSTFDPANAEPYSVPIDPATRAGVVLSAAFTALRTCGEGSAGCITRMDTGNVLDPATGPASINSDASYVPGVNPSGNASNRMVAFRTP